MVKHRKHQGDTADEPDGDKRLPDPPAEFCAALASLTEDEAPLWPLCPDEDCRRIRRCRTGEARHCSIDHEEFIKWLRYTIAAGRAGLSAVAAARAAVRRVLADRNGRPAGQRPQTGSAMIARLRQEPRSKSDDAPRVPKAKKRASDGDDDRGRLMREGLAELPDIHDGLRLWRYCTHKPCKRARRCCGDDRECTRRFPRVTAWLQQTIEGECAGLPPPEASRAAARQAFDGTGIRAVLGPLKTTQVEVKV